MRYKKFFKKTLSMFLSVLFLFSVMPANIAIAEEATENIIKEIAVSNLPEKTTYVENLETLDVTGGEVEIFYEDSSTEKVDMTLDMITGFDNTVIGKQELTVNYSGCTTSFEVEIIEMSTTDVPKTEEYQTEEQETTEEYSEEIIVETVEAEPKQSEFAGGDGTRDNPYLISTYDQLNNMRNYLSANFKLVNDIEIPDGSSNWTPVGSLSAPFKGTLDGNSYVIGGLTVYLIGSKNNNTYGGLFGYVDGSIIKNLGIINSEIIVKSSSTQLTYAVSGGITGYSEKTEIKNCYNNGEILATSKSLLSDTVNDINVYSYAGGISGYALNSSITNCYYDGSILADSTLISANRYYTETYAYAGGISGILNDSNIINSYNTGNIKANPHSTTYVSSYGYAGGITGYMKNNSLVETCYNAGNITLSPTNCIYVYSGGIAGYVSDSSIMNSYNTMNVIIYSSNNYAYAGGIAGYTNESVVEYCYNIGNIVADMYSGGAFGYINNSDIKSCYYLNNIYAGCGYGSGDINSCTYEEMKDKGTFRDYDFENIWIIGEKTYPLPVLKSIGTPKIKAEENTTEFAGGTGTAVNPFKIATKEQLNNVRNYLSSNFVLVNDIEFTKSDFQENGKYYNDGQYWAPIGTKANPFSGVFDGNGYTISGFKINLLGTQSNYLGLFGYLKNGKIENLGTTNSEITVDKYNNNFYLGGIVGYLNGGVILNCFNTGHIVVSSNTNIKAFVTIGGIAGYVNNGYIFGCYNSGYLTSNEKNNSYVLASGGIAGYVTSKSEISNCYNTGNIGTGNENGGIAGYFNVNCLIINCYNIGMISNITEESGGIVGYAFLSSSDDENEIPIKNCYYLNTISTGIGEGGNGNEEAIRCSIEDMALIDTFNNFDFETLWKMGDKTYPLPVLKNLGITKTSMEENKTEFSGGTGTLFDPYRIATKEQLNNIRFYPYNCFVLINNIEFDEEDFSEGGEFYNNGEYWNPIGNNDKCFSGIFDGGGYTISGLKVNITDSDKTNVGLFGYIRNSIIKNLGMTNSNIYIKSSKSSGYIRAGGIVGYLRDSIIYRCYNSGTVIGEATTTDIYSRAGGIVGELVNGIVYDCYNNGYIKANECLDYSKAEAGGILGVGYDSEIKYCYDVGNVVGSSVIDKSIGTISGAIYRCTMTYCYYWDKFHFINQSEEMIAVPCTWDSMMRKETFNGFDFEDIWTMGDKTYPFPVLKIIGTPEFKDGENTIEFAGGKGTLFDPYKISTKEQLNNIRNYPTACFEIIADIEFAESDFSKNGAFYNGGQGWEPIGSEEEPFSGIIFGKNHNISGIKIRVSASGYKYLGLFGYVRNGLIKDLNVSDVDILVKLSSVDSKFYIGGIVGHSMNTAIVNCYSSGKIEGTAVSSSSTIFTGGISGYTDSFSSIRNCINTCNITATATSLSSNTYVGGISGYIFGTIEKCNNNGNLNSKSSYGKAYAGGIGGNLIGNAIDCDNSGKINGETNASSDTSEGVSTYVGGISGYLGTNGSIINCHNENNVMAKSTSSSSGAYAYGGGITGYILNAEICNSYNNAIVESVASATKNTYSRSGGIVGYQSGGKVSKCYNTGDMSASASSVNTVYAQSGGISGLVNNGTINDCYNAGDVSVNISTTTMLSNARSGGIAGYLTGKISECYNTGNISAESSAYNTTAFGGICGECADDATVVNCYYLDNMLSGIGKGSGDTTVCTINDMQQEGTYFGFDFDTVWIMDGSDSYLLPKLQGIEQGGEKTLTSIELTSVPIKTKYLQGKDSLDITGGKLTLKYSDGTSEVIDLSADMVSGFDNSKVGKQMLTITYSGKTTSYDVEIIAKSLSRIEVSTLPDKTKYFQSKDNLDVEGGKITLYYNDNSSEIIDMTEAMVSGFDNTKTGFQTLTVTYNGKTATFKVEIIVKSVSSITVSTLPDKTEYAQNQDTLDVTGGKITVNYNDGTSEIINLTSDMVSGFNNSTVGTKTLTVTYGGKSTTYKIEIVESSENEFAGGDGTEDNPYLISTMEHLDNVRKYPSAYFKLLKDISIISIPNWEPIDLYSGNFDGNGHYIYGLRINVPEAENYSDFGLFGHVGDSVIKNLGVVDSEISVEVSGSNSDLSVSIGGIAGTINNTTIEKCYFDGNITASASLTGENDYASASVSAGGISGFVYGSSVISECYNISNIKATANAESSYDYSFVGGIAGNLYEGEVKNCYNIGNMHSDGYSGGISGKTEGYEDNPLGKIINCYNTGEITSTDYYSGGISGVIYDSAENCYYLDNISKGTESGYDDMTCCTLEEMKQQETFEGFDFETVWTMEGEDKYLLPKLRRTHTIFTKSLYSIEVSTLPNKTEYIVGTDNLDVAGGKLTLNYNTGISEIIDLTSDMVSGFDNNKEGNQVLTVTYGNKTTTFEVTVLHVHNSDGDWHFDENNHWKVCADENCGEIIDSTKAEHDFVWIIDKQATQEETGLMHEECSVCGYIRNENTEIPVLDHVHFGIEHHDVLEATCHSTGNIEYWTCSSNQCSGKYYIDADCKTEIKTITIPINPENHAGETEIQNYIKETCTEDGYSGDIVCKSCGVIIEAGTVISKHGHVYENGECIECGLRDPSAIIGDVNMDGVIAIIDVTLIQKFIANLDILEDFSEALADVDGNGRITTEDVTLIQIMIANGTV
ncbi:MAG: bacterial Ig-like domain-containing protein [Acutalibacteraceae bacterium]|nr:bacterial Ig-like domain-containing protein [Acutalibacteraceae bacterium]